MGPEVIAMGSEEEMETKITATEDGAVLQMLESRYRELFPGLKT